MPENALFQGCFAEVSFATHEGNQLSYFQHDDDDVAASNI